jgi:hypothetical protein
MDIIDYNEVTNKVFLELGFTQNDLKGYNYEVEVKHKLEQNGYSFWSNPLDNIIEWKKYQGKGSDFKLLELNTELEAKNITGKVFPSWIKRDWIPRFSYKNEIRITTIPETTKLSIGDMELLFLHDINITSLDGLKYLTPSRGNKLVEVISSEPSIMSNRRSNNYSSKPIQSQKHSLNITKTETLNQYLASKNVIKTDKKEGHSEPKLDCSNCLKQNDSYILKFTGSKISQHKIKQLWRLMTHNKKSMPFIEAFNLKREEYLRIHILHNKQCEKHGVDPNAGDLKEYGETFEDDDSMACVLNNKNKYLIFRRIDSIFTEKHDLLHELRHILKNEC